MDRKMDRKVELSPLITPDKEYWQYVRKCSVCNRLIFYAGANKLTTKVPFRHLNDFEWGECDWCNAITRQQLVAKEDDMD